MESISSLKDYVLANVITINNDWNPSVLVVITTTVLAIYVFVTVTYFRSTDSNNDSDIKDNVPWAPDAIPLLGHALAYRVDPPGFLLNTRKQCGPLFRLNLAGKVMFLVCGPDEQRQLANVPESILSSKHAVADIGFEQTLGYKNVYDGTILLKGIVKGILHTANADKQLTAWLMAIRESLNIELLLGDKEIDFFYAIRRGMLRATVEVFIGKVFLKDWKSYDFLKEFMDLQDKIEGKALRYIHFVLNCILDALILINELDFISLSLT
jgi:hypothetical protein